MFELETYSVKTIISYLFQSNILNSFASLKYDILNLNEVTCRLFFTFKDSVDHLAPLATDMFAIARMLVAVYSFTLIRLIEYLTNGL